MKFTWKKLIIMGVVQATLLIGFGLAYMLNMITFGVYIFIVIGVGLSIGVIAGNIAQ